MIDLKKYTKPQLIKIIRAQEVEIIELKNHIFRRGMKNRRYYIKKFEVLEWNLNYLKVV